MSDAPLGGAYLPKGQRGWNGEGGWVPIQGPIPRPEGYVTPPKPEEVAEALVVTSWVCPFCKADNDVWGEGAIGSWMECAKCGREAFLEWDLP